MLSSASYLLHHSHRSPLAASVIALFAVSTTSAWAVPPAVTNCNDSGAGSLRYAVDPVNGAVSGDTIDMSGLGCSTITLTTGAISITQNTLTLHGPGKKALTIAGDYVTPEHDRIITHNPATPGHLYIDNLRVGFGYLISSTGSAYGGCIAALNGSLNLIHVGAYYCTAKTTATNPPMKPFPKAFGGGVFATGQLDLLGGSVLLHNTATATEAGIRVQGGCAFAFGRFEMRDSVVAYCNAIDTNAAGSHSVFGGALELRSYVTITGSLIARSYSSYDVGGVDASGAAGTGFLTAIISNSTITENNAKNLIGGLYSNLGHVAIDNSTIVRNTAGTYTYNTGVGTYFNAPGVSVVSSVYPVALDLESSIIANNSAGGTQEDLAIGASNTGVTISGSNNLVRTYKSDVTLPSGQGNLTGICPLLGPIRDNGGATPTHALQSGSPAIDAGNNTANDPFTGVPAPYDERGGPTPPPIAQPPDGYPRVSGPSADIGAYEVQKTDIVFNAEFETGCE